MSLDLFPIAHSDQFCDTRHGDSNRLPGGATSPFAPAASVATPECVRWRGNGIAISVSAIGDVRPLLPGLAVSRLWMADHPSAKASQLTLDASRKRAALSARPPCDALTLVEIASWRIEEEFGAGFSLGSFENSRDPKVEALVRVMVSTVVAERYRAAVLGALSSALCRTLAVASGAHRSRRNDAWLNPNALRRTAALIEDRLDENLNADLLAATSGLSTSAFLRAFRGSMGITPGEYVTTRRTARAENFLKSTALPVAVIARACGFGSAAHFSTTFKARRGLRPSVLRRHAHIAVPQIGVGK